MRLLDSSTCASSGKALQAADLLLLVWECQSHLFTCVVLSAGNAEAVEKLLAKAEAAIAAAASAAMEAERAAADAGIAKEEAEHARRFAHCLNMLICLTHNCPAAGAGLSALFGRNVTLDPASRCQVSLGQPHGLASFEVAMLF